MNGYSEQTKAHFIAALDYKSPEELTGKQVKGHAGAVSGQGPYISVYLAVDETHIREATFQTYGCPACIA